MTGGMKKPTPTERRALDELLRAIRRAKKDRWQVSVVLEWWNPAHGDGLVLMVTPAAPGWTRTIAGGKILPR